MIRATRTFERLEPRTMLSADACPGASLHGVAFLLDESGPPAALPDAQIRLLDEHGAELATATTDDAGAYAFEDLPPGLYAIHQQPIVGFDDAGSNVGNGGGIALSDNLLGDIPVACGDAFAGYDFYDAIPADADSGNPPPLRMHSSTMQSEGLGENVILQPAMLQPGTSPAAARGLLVLAPAASERFPQGRLPSAEAIVGDAAAADANLATRRPLPTPTQRTRLLEEIFSGESIIDGAVDAARWLDEAWNRFSQWHAASQSTVAVDAEASASDEASSDASPADQRVAERNDPTSET